MITVTGSQRLIGVAAVIAAATLWGSTGTIQTLLPEGREPLAVGALRLLFGAAALLLLAFARADCRRAAAGLPWGGVIFAGVAIGAYNLFFFQAVSLTGVGIGTAIAIGGAPILATMFQIAVERRWPTRMLLIGQGVSITGVGVLALAGAGAEKSLTGMLIALAAGAAYASYSLATSRIGRSAPSTAIAAATFTVAALIVSPVLFTTPLTWLSGPETWAALLFLGFGATGLSYALYTWGLTRVSGSTAVTLALAEPITAWLLATAVVDEPLTTQKITGAALTLVGLIIFTLVPARR